MEKTVTKKNMKISPIWILPLISLLIGGWLLYTSIQQKGINITLNVDTATRFTVGKTQVMFKGIQVGTVEKIQLAKDLKSVNLTIEMDKKTINHLVADTVFWVVEPKVSISKIEGIETLLTGNYISVYPGKSNVKKRKFEALVKAPIIIDETEGLVLTLTTKQSSMHHLGDPILYKKIKVGEVKGVNLNQENNIELVIMVFNEYRHLINQSTNFWDISGLEIKATLPEIKIKMGTLESLFSGGISFTTDDNGEKLTSNKFILYDDQEKALQANHLSITLQISSSDDVEVGTLIKYQNKRIGMITKVTLGKNLKALSARALISRKAKKLILEGSYFWTVRPKVQLSGIHNLDAIISGNYLQLLPGSGKPYNKFIVHTNPPANIAEPEGLNLILTNSTLGSVKRGTDVNYRQVNVGHVTGYKLSPNRHKVLIYINIHKQFVDLISPDTKFWDTSGIRITGGLLTKMSISTDSLETIIAGGISLATPPSKNNKPEDKLIETTKPGDTFILHSNVDEEWLEWLEWKPDNNSTADMNSDSVVK